MFQDKDRAGSSSVTFLVSGLDDQLAELKAKGAEFTMEPNNIRPGTRIAFLRGPEGVSIELLERS